MKPYNTVTPENIEVLKKIVGEQNIIQKRDASAAPYSKDYTENLAYPPDVILKPTQAAQVACIMRYCNENRIPVTPRGGGTGLSGGCLAHMGGVLLSMEKFNKIINIDEENLQVITEPGVVTEVLQEAVKKKKLSYPPDPSSKGSCFIGGNIAENSGGPKAVKYGVVKDYVLNLELILASGETIWTGANVLKNATGYNLTQLIVGSEGTLGIITKIVLKLIPAPQHDLIILVPFKSLQSASKAVSHIFQKGYTPSVLELMEKDALKLASDFSHNNTIPIEDDIEGHLIIEVDGMEKEVLEREIEGIAALLNENYEIGEILFAEDAKQKEELWKLRRCAAEAAKTSGYVIEEDIVVPRASLPEIIHYAKSLSKKYKFDCICYGHAGDGNLHIRIKKEGTGNTKDDPELQEILTLLFKKVAELKGTISGEHGIGILQKTFLPIVIDKNSLNLMIGIKKVFDPNNIVNPGKIFNLPS